MSNFWGAYHPRVHRSPPVTAALRCRAAVVPWSDSPPHRVYCGGESRSPHFVILRPGQSASQRPTGHISLAATPFKTLFGQPDRPSTALRATFGWPQNYKMGCTLHRERLRPIMKFVSPATMPSTALQRGSGGLTPPVRPRQPGHPCFQALLLGGRRADECRNVRPSTDSRIECRGLAGVRSQNRAFLLPKGRSASGFGRKIGPFRYRRVSQPGGSVAKSGFFATEGQVARGFSRKIGLFCYRRVGQPGGSVAKPGFFATEGQVDRGFSRKIGPFCYRR